MKYSQMNLRSGLMARVQRKLDETKINESIPENNEDENIFSSLSETPCQIIKPIKVRQRQRGKQNMGWMFK